MVGAAIYPLFAISETVDVLESKILFSGKFFGAISSSFNAWQHLSKDSFHASNSMANSLFGNIDRHLSNLKIS